MRFITPSLSALALTLSFVVASHASLAHAEPPRLSAEEFKLWKDYTLALEDERVQKMPENKRMGAIAKNFRVKEADLRKAVEKGETEGPQAAERSKATVETLVGASDLKGRLGELRVDTSEGHVVTYLSWTNLDGQKLEEEAALAAHLAAKGAPISSTIALWATDAASGRKVFEAKISAQAASKFQENRIAMFAQARYIRQFEDVRNAYKGTPPVDVAPTANAAN